MAGRKNGKSLREIGLKGNETVSIYDYKGEEYKTPLESLKENVLKDFSQKFHGFFDIKTAFESGGSATDTTIVEDDVDTWLDVNFIIEETIDKRPTVMIEENPIAYDSTTGLFKLGGLGDDSFGALSSALSFDPDEDNGELSVRVLFNSNSGGTSFIEDVAASMAQGADDDYVLQPLINFIITDNINTNGSGIEGTCKFQVKSTVPGTVSMRELTYFLYK